MKGKHLQLDERIRIQVGLEKGSTLTAIAREIGRSPTTISNEIRRWAEPRKSGALGKSFHDCLHRRECEYSELCKKPGCRRERCRGCADCLTFCDKYEKETCTLVSLPPYTCNGCNKRQRCSLEKWLYNARHADEQYRLTLSQSRSGPGIEEGELLRVDAIVSPLIRKGQSINHIFSTHNTELMLSERTMYDYIGSGLLGVDNLDLPRKVRYRPRKKKQDKLKIEKACRVGRSYADYLEYVESNPDIHPVQMDTVEGRKGGKVVLTLHFPVPKFMLIFIRDANTAKSVENVFNYLYETLGHDTFEPLFGLVLTDNGSEFSNPSALELTTEGVRRSRIFYCDPSASFQKGAIENNHELLRKVVQKGKPFDPYTQANMNLLASHINALRKKSLNGKSPYEAFAYLYGEETLSKLGIDKVGSDDVILKPSLLS
jgi:transposase, IS30 family